MKHTLTKVLAILAVSSLALPAFAADKMGINTGDSNSDGSLINNGASSTNSSMTAGERSSYNGAAPGDTSAHAHNHARINTHHSKSVRTNTTGNVSTNTMGN
jgi:hypothetical protein